MPYSMSELLGPWGRRELDTAIHEEPRWWMAAGIATAVVVVTVALATYFSASPYVESPATLGVLLTIVCAPFLLQLRVPLSSTLCTYIPLAGLVALNLFGKTLGVYDLQHGHDQNSLIILIWLVGATASVASRRDLIIVTAGALVVAYGRDITDPTYQAGHIWALGIVIAFLAGLFIRSLTVALLNTKLAEAAVKEQAVTAERQRIAREVHDVIAHSMTVTMLHLTAARLAVNRGDNAAATEALEEAERAGRTSLNEIRNTVGLLRTDDDSGRAAPRPTASDVTTLVEGYRIAGTDVQLDVVGDLASVDIAAGLALYRVVQESLTNASRHAPGSRCTVHVDVGPPLRVDVRNNGGEPVRPQGNGMGLTGMAERVHALGGSFVAGPTADGWAVEATIA